MVAPVSSEVTHPQSHQDTPKFQSSRISLRKGSTDRSFSLLDFAREKKWRHAFGHNGVANLLSVSRTAHRDTAQVSSNIIRQAPTFHRSPATIYVLLENQRKSLKTLAIQPFKMEEELSHSEYASCRALVGSQAQALLPLLSTSERGSQQVGTEEKKVVIFKAKNETASMPLSTKHCTREEEAPPGCVTNNPKRSYPPVSRQGVDNHADFTHLRHYNR
ncbi:hypothetical protein SK355_03725 [Candidatus Fukatsuia symbiotica]|uniref:Uncharacterized protein n=1 Tax=Candidatus Fukatsuia symbiotica TaxID=1878942 RepID=A0A2U8I5N6_9GAMM|nr:hypothetical protein [Candidatus Fukatsuia symbiotica]AWK13525.1 hypothetical protein CCS41_01825 [Candidatus Fukatsuia symbiotica]MEA9444429.1 hypothetical protein [Candidatus Fukatsuia symbiotica]